MKLTMPGWLSWMARRILRPRCYGVSVLLTAGAVGLFYGSMSATGNVAAVQPSPAPVPLPRLIQLFQNIPNSILQLKRQLETKALLGKMEFSTYLESRHVGVASVTWGGASPPYAVRSEFFSYHNGGSDAVFSAISGAESYRGEKGNRQFSAIFDSHFVNKVFIVVGKRNVKAAPLLVMPSWLAKRISCDPDHPWNITDSAIIRPDLTVPPAAASFCRSASITINPCRADFSLGTSYLRLGFGRYRRGHVAPPLRTVEIFTLRKRRDVDGEGIFALRTGRRTVTIQIHLSADGLKKLGFTVVALTAKTPAPAINPLTQPQIARAQVMRERFEKWAGVWREMNSGGYAKVGKR